MKGARKYRIFSTFRSSGGIPIILLHSSTRRVLPSQHEVHARLTQRMVRVLFLRSPMTKNVLVRRCVSLGVQAFGHENLFVLCTRLCKQSHLLTTTTVCSIIVI